MKAGHFYLKSRTVHDQIYLSGTYSAVKWIMLVSTPSNHQSQLKRCIMMKHFVACLAISAFAVGCGETQQKYEKQVLVQPAALDSFRANITALTTSNQLDSGSEGLVDQVDQLKSVEGVNVDELKPLVQKLVKEPRSVAANAKAILAKLPPAEAKPAEPAKK